MRWYRFYRMAAGIGILVCVMIRIAMAGQQPLPTAKPEPSAQAASGSQQIRLMAQRDSSDTPDNLAFSPNGRLLASGGIKTTTLWDVATGAEMGVLPGVGYSLAFTPDGTQLTALGYENTDQGMRGVALIWDVSAGKQVARIHCPVNWLNYGIFSPDARLVATMTQKRTIAICDIRADGKTWELEAPHAEATGSYGRGVFSRQGDRFAAIQYGARTLDVWEVKTGKLLHSIPDIARMTGGLVFSPDGNFMAGSDGNLMAGLDRNGITLWNIAEGTPPRTLTPANTQVRTLAFAADSKTIVGACADQTLRLWNVETGKQIASFPAPLPVYKKIGTLAFAPDGKTIFGSCTDDTLRSWDVATGRQIASIPGNGYVRSSIPLSPDGRYLATRENHAIKLWNVSTGKEYRQFHGTALAVHAAAFSPDGRTLALGDGVGTVHLWDTTRGQSVRTLTGHKAQILFLAFSPDGRWLVDSSWDDTVRVWDLKTGALAHVFPRESPSHTGLRRWSADQDHDPAWTVGFSPDSRLVAAAGGGNIRVWGVGGWQRRFTLKGHDGSVRSVLFTGDGKQIITAGGNYGHTGPAIGEVRVWSATDGKFLQQVPSQNSGFWWLAAPADSQAGWFASVSGSSIVLWDTHTWKERRVLAPPKYTDMLGDLPMIAVSPDGKRMAGGYGGMLCLWEVATGRLLDSAALHADAINSVAFSPDGTHLVTGSSDTTARLWAISADRLQPLCTVYLFQNNTWAVSDAQNRFDAANSGDVDGLHGVVNGEPVALSQLKSRYYDPGLLAKYLSQNKAPLKPLDLP